MLLFGQRVISTVIFTAKILLFVRVIQLLSYLNASHGSEIQNANIVHHSNADALSRSPFDPAPQKDICNSELQVVSISSTLPSTSIDIANLLLANLEAKPRLLEKNRGDIPIY